MVVADVLSVIEMSSPVDTSESALMVVADVLPLMSMSPPTS